MHARYRSGFFHRAVLVLPLFACAWRPAYAGTVQVVTYTPGATGIWNDAAKWDLNVIPNNIGTTTNYKAVIGSPSSVVNLSLGVTRTVDGLDLGGTLNLAGTLNVSNLNSASNFNAGLLTNTNTLNVSSGGKLAMLGGSTVISNGSAALITIASGGELSLDSTNLSLTGGGALTLSGTAKIRGVNGTESLFNSSTITGAGTIQNVGYFQNDGNIVASGGTLTIQPGASGFYNNGTLTATGTLTIANDGLNGPWSNLSGSTLYGGMYDVTGTLNYNGAQLEILSGASVTLHGTGKILASGVNALAPLHTLHDANLTLDGATRSTAGDLTVSRTGSVNLSNRARLTVNGDLLFQPGDDASGETMISEAVLDLDNSDVTVTGGLRASTVLVSGELGNVTAASLQNVGMYDGKQTLLFGNISVSGGSDLVIGSGSGIQRIFYGAGVSLADGGTTFTINGTHALAGLNQNDGVLSLAGSSQSLSLGSFSNGGEVYLSNGAGIAFSGALTNTGTFSHSGGNVTSAGLNNTGALVVNAGSSFDASSGTFSNYSAGTLTQGTYSLGGTFIVNNADITRNNANVSLGPSTSVFVDASTGLFAMRNLNTNNGTFELTSRTLSLGSLLQGETGFDTPVLKLNSASTLNIGGNLTNQAGTKVYVNSGSVLNVTGSMTGGAFTETYVNSGTVNAGSFSNPGKLSMSQGTFSVTNPNGFLSVNGSGKLFEGEYELAGSAFNYTGQAIQTIGGGVTLSLTNSTISHLGGSGNAIAGLSAIETGGTLLVGSGSPVNFSAGSLTNNGALYLENQAANFAGAVVNNGTMNATGSSAVTALSLQNSGSLLVGSNSTLTVGALSNVSGGILSGGNYHLEDGILRANNTSGITQIAAGTTVRLEGAAVLQNDLGANAFSGLAQNSGSLTLEQGQTLATSAPMFTNSHILVLQSDGSLTTDGFTSTGSVHIADGTIQINGTFGNVTGNTLQGGSWTLDSSGVGATSYVRFDSGQINQIASNATVALYGQNAGFSDSTGATDRMNMLASNAGTLGLYGRSLTTGAALFANSGNLTVSDAILTTNSMTNAGTTSIGAGARVVATNGYTQAAGTTTNDGIIDGDLTISGGTLKGTGTTTGNLTVGNGGTLSPGSSPGTYTVDGNFTNAGTLSMEIGGAWQGLTYDWLDILGTAYLGGTLKVTFVDGFSAADLNLGDVFTLITWAGRVGEFTGFDLPTLGAGRSFQWFYNDFDLELRVSPTPEPGTLLLLGSALLALASCARRRLL